MNSGGWIYKKTMPECLELELMFPCSSHWEQTASKTSWILSVFDNVKNT